MKILNIWGGEGGAVSVGLCNTYKEMFRGRGLAKSNAVLGDRAEGIQKGLIVYKLGPVSMLA